VIDGLTNAMSTVKAGIGAVAVNEETNRTYVCNGGSPSEQSLTVIKGSTNSTTRVQLGRNCTGLTVNDQSNLVYVANNQYGSDGHGKIAVVDGSNNVHLVEVGDVPYTIAVNRSTNRAYVANLRSDSVTVIDGTSFVKTVPVGKQPFAVAANPVTNKIFVANSADDTVTVIDANDNDSTSIVKVGTYPIMIGVNTTTNQIYVVNRGSNNVTVIDGTTLP
jgi:YVTN family beta-propeller protein